jgi:hypothetical protein
MQKNLLSTAENQTCYQVDEFGSKRAEERSFGHRWKRRRGWACRYGRGLDLYPCSQATAHESRAAFEVFSSSIRLDGLSAEPFVGRHGSLRNRRSYVGFRGFFLAASARSKLRR